jgi:uncharacterized membrane protein
LATSLVFDLIHLLTDNEQWAEVAYWMIAAGIIGGLAAAPPGWIDWFALPAGTRAKAIGLGHGVGNVVVLVLFAVNWFLRREAPHEPGALEFVLSLVGVTLAVVTGWLGGELVDRLGVGVERGAHLDAPNSLSGRPTRERSSAPRGRA